MFHRVLEILILAIKGLVSYWVWACDLLCPVDIACAETGPCALHPVTCAAGYSDARTLAGRSGTGGVWEGRGGGD